GTVVTITGSGWKPGESVTLSLVESPNLDTHGPYVVTADGEGNIIDAEFAPDAQDLNVRFFLSAVGSVTGLQARTSFMDSRPATVTVGAQTGTLTAGTAGNVTFAVSVGFNGNGNPCTTLPLTVSGLPGGASGTFTPSTVSDTNGNTTLKISTTNAAPGGLYTFTVTAINGASPCQGGSASNTGTLSINSLAPTLTSISPTVGVYGGSGFTLIANG